MADTELDMLIRSSESGDAKAREQLFTVLYAELHALAQRQLRRNSAMTLSPTTLLHETYLDMASRRSGALPKSAAGNFRSRPCRPRYQRSTRMWN